LRLQCEQLHSIACSISPSASKAIAPQWQLPVWIMVSSFGKN